jgi:outer membrane protein TolC
MSFARKNQPTILRRYCLTTRIGCRVRIATLLFALGISAAWADDDQRPGRSVDSLLQMARAQNPEYAASRHEAQAAAERIYPAGAFADPKLVRELEIAALTNTGGHETANGKSSRFKLVQELPFWGKRDLRRAVATAEADEASGRADATWNELAARIKSVFAQYYVIARTEVLTREVLDVLTHLEQTAQVRYQLGLASQEDVLLAQAEQTTTRTELVGLETEERNLQYRINALLKRPPNAPLATPERLRPIPVEKLDYIDLEQRLKSRNPQLFANDAAITAAEKGRELTYRNRWPDPAVGVSVIRSQDGRFLFPGLYFEISIPLQQPRRRSEEREAEERLAAAQERRDATENQLQADLAQSLASLDGAMRTQKLLETSLIPQAELTLRSAQKGYEAGRTNFSTQLDAERRIRKVKLDLLRFEAETQLRLADIERLIGEDL